MQGKFAEEIADFCLMDDEFLSEVFDGQLEIVEFLLHILLERTDLRVTQAETQVEYKSATQRSIKLDIRAEDAEGKVYDIEIQRSDKGSSVRRARMYSSMIDRTLLDKGDDFDELVDTYVIFITEKDKFGYGLPLYHIDRMIRDIPDASFGDGSHILYVNGEYRNEETPVGRLMHDFHCKAPKEMFYPVLSERVQYFKEKEGGHTQMSRIMEKLIKEATEEVTREVTKEVTREVTREVTKEVTKKSATQTALRMLTSGKLALEEIAEFSGLPIEEVRELAARKTA